MSDHPVDELVHEVILEDGKYTVRFYQSGRLVALRNGRDWQNLAGNKMILSLLQHIDSLRKENQQLQEMVDRLAEDEGVQLGEENERRALRDYLRFYVSRVGTKLPIVATALNDVIEATVKRGALSQIGREDIRLQCLNYQTVMEKVMRDPICQRSIPHEILEMIMAVMLTQKKEREEKTTSSR